MDRETTECFHTTLAQLMAVRLIVELLLGREIKKAGADTAAERLDGLWKSLSQELAEIRLPSIPGPVQDDVADRLGAAMDDIFGSVRARLSRPEI